MLENKRVISYTGTGCERFSSVFKIILYLKLIKASLLLQVSLGLHGIINYKKINSCRRRRFKKTHLNTHSYTMRRNKTRK